MSQSVNNGKSESLERFMKEKKKEEKEFLVKVKDNR